MDHHDWTERYRPESLAELEGNGDKLRRVKQWLKFWEEGKIPKKKGMLLSGPPGVGKTTLALAVARERDWTVIELNASEQRNAASIRSSATRGSQHFSLEQFSSSGNNPGRTLILLDEVDHLSGGFSKVSEERIAKSLGESDVQLKGDSGGKAELLYLLKNTFQPVIMTCNDPMRLWGGGRNWRVNRDRVMRLSENVIFDRVRRADLRRVAHKIMDSEEISMDPESLERLIEGNSGDFRALVKDLQSLNTSEKSHVDIDDVRLMSQISVRDSQINVFEALKKIYSSKNGSEANSVLINTDRDPEEMLAWFAWNNQSIMDKGGLSAISAAMCLSDSALSVKFTNRAFRSWYWGSALSSQAAVAFSNKAGSHRLHIGYPDFLRRGSESWRTSILIDKLAAIFSTSKSSVRDYLWPNLLAIHDESLGGDADDFKVAKNIGLSAEDHLSLHGIPKSGRRAKSIIDRFEDEVKDLVIEPIIVNEVESVSQTDEVLGKQYTLDGFD